MPFSQWKKSELLREVISRIRAKKKKKKKKKGKMGPLLVPEIKEVPENRLGHVERGLDSI